MSKCAFCGNEVSEDHPIASPDSSQEKMICCSDSCAAQAEDFVRFFERTKTYFLIGMAISLVFIFVAVFVLSSGSALTGGILMASGFVALGVTAILFPFATPQTFSMFGIRKARKITKVLGICLIAMGPVLGLLMNLP